MAAAERKRMSVRKIKFLIAGVIIVSAFAYLAVSGFQSENLVYFLTVDEASRKAPTLGDRGIRVQGKIVPRTLLRNPDAMRLAFHMQGEERTLPVSYRGVPPDLLENGFPVIAEGRLNDKGVLVAKNLMVACPSKFEEMKEAGESIPANHGALMEQAARRDQAPPAR